MTKFYVVSPANFETGGVELLHQLVCKLNKIKENSAVIYYYNFISTLHENPTPSIYMKYTKGEYVIEIDDNYNNVLILPEILINNILNYQNIRIAIWWLSVDNYFISVGKKISYKEYKKGKKYLLYKLLNYLNIDPNHDLNPFRKNILQSKRIILHAYQSEYARLFLEKQNFKPTLPLSDFLNDTFFQDKIRVQNREDIILYNPQKGIEITKELMTFMSNYNWIALENYAPSEMKDLMKKSKIYIDFGNHPGKDRIPREAAINGCVIVTNKKGAANNSYDIPINEEYKFEDPIKGKEVFKDLVDNIYLDFEKHFQQFDFYRSKIKNEERIFEKELLIFYSKCSQ